MFVLFGFIWDFARWVGRAGDAAIDSVLSVDTPEYRRPLGRRHRRSHHVGRSVGLSVGSTVVALVLLPTLYIISKTQINCVSTNNDKITLRQRRAILSTEVIDQ